MGTRTLVAVGVFWTSSAMAQVTVAVDPSMDAHPISPLIYGMNFASDAQISAAKVPFTRWGGNSTSRYNYEIDTTNTGFDYFFENIPGCWGTQGNYCNPQPMDPKTNSGANAYLDGAKKNSMTAFFTIPTIGWVAKAPPKYNHPFDCGCPKSYTALQDQFDPYDTNCGNGMHNNQPVACPAPTTTSVAVDPQWAKTWVAYLVGRFGASNGARIYQLDNEPALWSSTHRDIHPSRLGYDELWQRMRDYGDAILQADPSAALAGPNEWGWPNYFCSDKDVISNGCSPQSPDRAMHGGEELVAWLLDQAKTWEMQNGKRLLHYLDLHYYPQGGNPPAITRSLWDPTYTDPSWINAKITLIPRMRDWVSQHYPGTKISVSEYDFYHHDEDVGAVTYAEVLGIFGREGLDAATAWSPPAPNERAFGAYKLYRNFDGMGGAFESIGVRTTITGNAFAAFGSVSKTRVTVALVNEANTSVMANVSFGNFKANAMGQVYLRTTGSTIARQNDVAIANGMAMVPLPAMGIAMLVVDGMNPNDLPDAGVPMNPDGGTNPGSDGGGTGPSDDGGTGNNGANGSSGGCGCNTSPAEGGAELGLFLAALAILSRKRR